jgi:GH15 family glucan-1,4-alpha-glucosidase
MSQVIKISKNTRKKISSFEIILLELFEKIIEVLTFRPVINYIENLIFIRKLALKSKFKKKPKVDKKVLKWEKSNPWFGKDMAMTWTALEIHRKLVNEEGFDPKSDEYYTEIDKRIYQEFPLKMKKYFSSNN